MTENILSVSELNERIRYDLSADMVLNSVCVLGEISNYKIYPSGHHYFTLKDSSSSLSCVIFARDASRLRFKPSNGMAVLAAGKISLYVKGGNYQLVCAAIYPAGAGELQLAFEQLKIKLQSEGLFDEEHKRSLPTFPSKIALVTSPAGAAVRDMIKILRKRWPLCEILIFPARVQGDEAAGELRCAVELASRYPGIDLIITGRGGGSAEDLWCFNDEELARAIYNSSVPVISAVGHEPDITISDYVCDRRASTPSNAAELAVPDVEEIKKQLLSLRLRLNLTLTEKINREKLRLSGFAASRILTDRMYFVDQRRQTLDALSERLIAGLKSVYDNNNLRYTRLHTALSSLNPLSVLSRGYAAVASDDKIITSAHNLKPQQQIRILFRDGEAGCTVNSINFTKEQSCE